jgi:hypothetical protein
MELDSTHMLSKQAAPALNYLSTSLYNDPLGIISEADPKTIQLAEDYVAKYKSLAVYLDPELDFTSKEIEFLLAMSTAYRKIPEKTQSNGHPFKSEQETAQYSLYVMQHNEGLWSPRMTQVRSIRELKSQRICLFL